VCVYVCVCVFIQVVCVYFVKLHIFDCIPVGIAFCLGGQVPQDTKHSSKVYLVGIKLEQTTQDFLMLFPGYETV
jgi:hypothetical protein